MSKDSGLYSFFSKATEKNEEDLSMSDSTVNSSELDSLDSIRKDEDGNQQLNSKLSATPEHANNNDSKMPHDARRVLVHLMRQGSLMVSQNSKLFELLCRHEIAIRKHLSEVYLRLVLDQKSGLAFVASSTYEQADYPAGNAPDIEEELEPEEPISLIYKRTLTLYDTLILLVLRKHYQDRESAGEQKITIDIERIESYLTPFLPITDHASKDRKKLLARVKEMVKRKVLLIIRGVEDRYEISPIIRYVVSADFLETMLKEYATLVAELTDGVEVKKDINEQ